MSLVLAYFLSISRVCYPLIWLYQEGSLLWMPTDSGFHSTCPATPEQRADFLLGASRKSSSAGLWTNTGHVPFQRQSLQPECGTG